MTGAFPNGRVSRKGCIIKLVLNTDGYCTLSVILSFLNGSSSFDSSSREVRRKSRNFSCVPFLVRKETWDEMCDTPFSLLSWDSCLHLKATVIFPSKLVANKFFTRKKWRTRESEGEISESCPERWRETEVWLTAPFTFIPFLLSRHNHHPFNFYFLHLSPILFLFFLRIRSSSSWWNGLWNG